MVAFGIEKLGSFLQGDSVTIPTYMAFRTGSSPFDGTINYLEEEDEASTVTRTWVGKDVQYSATLSTTQSNGSSIGELGLGDRETRTTPTKVGDDWKEVAGGVSHLCGIKKDNSLYCWGTNAYAELGLGMIDEVHEINHVRDTPQRVIDQLFKVSDYLKDLK